MKAASAFTPPQVGAMVRCFFGTQSRDGTVEHIDRGAWAHVRLSPGWVHQCPLAEVLELPAVIATRIKLRAVS